MTMEIKEIPAAHYPMFKIENDNFLVLLTFIEVKDREEKIIKTEKGISIYEKNIFGNTKKKSISLNYSLSLEEAKEYMISVFKEFLQENYKETLAKMNQLKADLHKYSNRLFSVSEE